MAMKDWTKVKNAKTLGGKSMDLWKKGKKSISVYPFKSSWNLGINDGRNTTRQLYARRSTALKRAREFMKRN